MAGNYILKNSNGAEMGFCSQGGSILLKGYVNSRWESQGSLGDNLRNNFSLSVDYNGGIYIICQERGGDVVLINSAPGGWNRKVILKSRNGMGNNVLFYSVIHRDNMELIYAVENSGRKSDIMYQTVSKGVNNSTAQIDLALNINESHFKLQRTGENAFIIMYLKNLGDNRLGYMEFKNGQKGDFVPIHKTGYKIVDSAFVAQGSVIHFLYIVKGMFSSQLIYRRVQGASLSQPIIIYEGQGINSCAVFISMGRIYCSWIMNRQLFFTSSDMNGINFQSVERNKKYSSVSWIKAAYVSLENTGDFYSNEIYMDTRRNNEPVFMKEFMTVKNARNISAENAVKVEENAKTQEFSVSTIAEERLRNQLEIERRRSGEKDEQIMKLNEAIKSKNEEILHTESRFLKKIAELRNEIEKQKKLIDKIISDNKQRSEKNEKRDKKSERQRDIKAENKAKENNMAENTENIKTANSKGENHREKNAKEENPKAENQEEKTLKAENSKGDNQEEKNLRKEGSKTEVQNDAQQEDEKTAK